MIWVADPILVEATLAPGALVTGDEGEVPEERGVLELRRHPQVLETVRPRVHLDGPPAEVEAELEGAARVDPVLIEVREADPRSHGGEMAVPVGRREPLGQGEVGAPARSDLPRRPRLGPAPLLGVVAVLGLRDRKG